MAAKTKAKKEYRTQYWNSIEEIYKARMGSFLKLASRHVYNKDLAIDCVHDALAKSVEYFNKHKERKVREDVINWLVLKACKKANKFSREVPFGDIRTMAQIQRQAHSEGN
jgi:hypothetical protein